jgi:lipoate-protein ligase A
VKIFAICDSHQSGFVNMAVDLCSMKLVEEKKADVVFRTYMWMPHCLSIGRFQKPEKEADVERLLADGYHIVQRPTGGRAVWHGHELTYSLVAAVSNPLVSGSIIESIEKVASIITAGLKQSGVSALLNSKSRELTSSGRIFNPCFTSHGRSEIITVDGRKLVGSAQARSRGVFIEHGSILFTNQQTRAVDYLPLEASEEQRATMREVLQLGVGTVLEYNPALTPERLAECLHNQFACHADVTPALLRSGDLPGLNESVAERRRIIEKR